MILDALQVLRQQRGVLVDDVGGDVVQRAGLEPAHPQVTLEVGDRQALFDEPLAAARLEPRLDLLQARAG